MTSFIIWTEASGAWQVRPPITCDAPYTLVKSVTIGHYAGSNSILNGKCESKWHWKLTWFLSS